MAIAFATEWVRGLDVFIAHPYVVAPLAGAVLWGGAVAILELGGFVRLRELATLILAPKSVNAN